MLSRLPILCGLLALLLPGCAGTPRPVAGTVPAATQFAVLDTVAAAPVNQGLIAPSDVLSVTVYRVPDLSMASVVVAPDGTIQVPLLGNVQVAGYTASQVSQRLRGAFGAHYLVRPEVTVNVVSSPTRNLTVEGAVNQPGMYPFVPNTNLLGALALSRGMTRTARSESVTVFRTIGDARYLAVFDVDAIRAGRSADVLLQPGDTVVVGVSGRRQTWQDFLQTAPLLGLFARL